MVGRQKNRGTFIHGCLIPWMIWSFVGGFLLLILRLVLLCYTWADFAPCCELEPKQEKDMEGRL